MTASGTLELAKISKERDASFPLGSLVEVTYKQPDGKRSFTYLGTVAMRPEDKALMSEVTNKFGDERIIPLAETYTIKTLEKMRHDYYNVEGDAFPQCVSTPVRPVDLIFDPAHEQFDIQAVEPTVPSPR